MTLIIYQLTFETQQWVINSREWKLPNELSNVWGNMETTDHLDGAGCFFFCQVELTQLRLFQVRGGEEEQSHSFYHSTIYFVRMMTETKRLWSGSFHVAHVENVSVVREKADVFLFVLDLSHFSVSHGCLSVQQGRSMYHCWMFLILVCHTVSVCPDPKGSATRAPVDAKEIRAPQGHLHCHSFGVAPESRGNDNAARRPLKRPPQIHHKPAAAEASTEEPQAHRGPAQRQSSGISVQPSTTQNWTVSAPPDTENVRSRTCKPSSVFWTSGA